MMDPVNAVDQFLTSGPIKESKCQTCSLSNSEDIDKAIIYFHNLKEAGKTTQTWVDFHKFVLVQNFNYHLSCVSLRRHMRLCLELS